MFDDVERYDVGDIVGFQLERTHDPNFLELTFFKNKTVQGRSKLIPSNLVYYPAVSFSTNLCVEILSINYNSWKKQDVTIFFWNKKHFLFSLSKEHLQGFYDF